MRIKDPKRKIFKEDPVLSMDKYRNEFEGKIDCPLYAVYKEGKHFSIMYWDTCEIAVAFTLEEARNVIWKHVTMFDPKPECQDEIHDCGNCKYIDANSDNEPCSICIHGSSSATENKWEAWGE